MTNEGIKVRKLSQIRRVSRELLDEATDPNQNPYLIMWEQIKPVLAEMIDD